MTKHRHLNKASIALMKALQENEGAECGQLPEMFFPQGENMEMLVHEISIAKAICNRCPIQNVCAEYAMIAEEPYGIWGGLTPSERNILKRRR